MNYIEKARKILGLKIDVESELLDLYALLVFVKGEKTSLEDVHDAWSIWKNRIDQRHRSLIPFSGLSKDVQEMDREYTVAIRETAIELSQDIAV